MKYQKMLHDAKDREERFYRNIKDNRDWKKYFFDHVKPNSLANQIALDRSRRGKKIPITLAKLSFEKD